MEDKDLLYKFTAAAALLSAITTFLLWMLPKLHHSPSNFEEAVQLSANGYYVARQWVNLFHIPLALAAYFGFAYKVRHRALPAAGFGFVWFVIWGAIEMLGISGIIFAVNKTWRAQYPASDEATRKVLQSSIENFYTVWDSMFFVLLIAFLMGTILYACAANVGSKLERILSFTFWLGSVLTVFIILSGYAGAGWADAPVSFIYPILQPLNRILIAFFLWPRKT
jgi:glucan phosphoethanolaminetransferase (alkaline phosphatase superfamily)